MAVVKLSKSGKQVQFVDDSRPARILFVTSVAFLRNLLNGRQKFVLLNRMPDRVAVDRFDDSPVYDPQSGDVISPEDFVEEGFDDLRVGDDVFSRKSRDSRVEESNFEDKRVW